MAPSVDLVPKELALELARAVNQLGALEREQPSAQWWVLHRRHTCRTHPRCKATKTGLRRKERSERRWRCDCCQGWLRIQNNFHIHRRAERV